VEIRQLRYFVAVADELHFRRAAARLHISQPPLSQQIRALEEEMGCTLLARTRRRVELTPAGEAFLRDARALLSELDGAVDTARRIDAGQAGRLRVTFVGSALLSVVPGIVQRFRAARPGVVRPPLDEDMAELRCDVVLRERTVVALPVAHPLAALRRVPLRRLAAEPFVLFPRAQAPGFHDLLIGSVAAAGGPPRVVQYAPEMLTIIGLVAAGIGLSLVPASVARLALDGVTYRPVAGAPVAELVAITRAGDPSASVRAFVDQAISTFS